MNRNTKIVLYSIGGLVLLTGLGFGLSALFKRDEDGLTKSEREELERLRAKQRDGTLTQNEQDKLNQLDPNEQQLYDPGDGESIGLDGCSFPMRNGDNSKCVAKLQLAINQKHNNNRDGGSYNSCCDKDEFNQPLLVDGWIGGKTLAAVAKFYDVGCECKGVWYTVGIQQVCNCLGGKIGQSTYSAIISGADTSDEALASAGYSGFSGESYSNFSVPGYGHKQSSVMGDFYKGKYDFVDDNQPKSSLSHSYGLGIGFGFSGQQTGGGEIETVQEFIDNVP